MKETRQQREDRILARYRKAYVEANDSVPVITIPNSGWYRIGSMFKPCRLKQIEAMAEVLENRVRAAAAKDG